MEALFPSSYHCLMLLIYVKLSLFQSLKWMMLLRQWVAHMPEWLVMMKLQLAATLMRLTMKPPWL
jgi:hypothetical protein